MKKEKTYLVLSKDKDYVKNPMSMINMTGEYNIMQQKLLSNIVVKLQDRIRDYLDHRESREGSNKYDLFMPEEFDERGKIRIDLKLSDIVSHSKEWGRLEVAAKELSSVFVPVVRYDEKSNGMVKGWYQLMVCNIPTVNSKSNYKNGTMFVEIDKLVAGEVLNMRQGYAEHIKNIVYLCSCSKSPKIYEYLSNKFRRSDECVAEYAEIRKIMGATTYEQRGGKYIAVEKYKRYIDFNRRCLQPACDELRTLYLNGMGSDFYFEYDPIYLGNKKNGTPDKIRFILKHGMEEVAKQGCDTDKKEESKVVTMIKEYLRNRYDALNDVGRSMVDALLDGRLGKIEEVEGGGIMFVFNASYAPGMFLEQVVKRLSNRPGEINGVRYGMEYRDGCGVS